MVLLTITQVANDAIDIYYSSLDGGKIPSPKDGEPDLQVAGIGGPISHGQLIDISNTLKEASKNGKQVPCSHDLESLLKGARIYAPPPKPKPAKSAEYVALMTRLREEEERRAYERMSDTASFSNDVTRSSDSFGGPKVFGADGRGPAREVDDEITFSEVNRQMTLIINVLISIVACGIGVWLTAWHWPAPARLGLSMGGGAVVGIAEVAIYFGYIKRVSDAKAKERRQVESKEVVETWILDGKKAPRGGVACGRDESLRQRKGKHR